MKLFIYMEVVTSSINSSSIYFKHFVSYLNLNASCLACMNDFQHQSGRQHFCLQVRSKLCLFCSLSSISSAGKSLYFLNWSSRSWFSSFVIVYLICMRTLFLRSMARSILSDSSWIMLSRMSKTFILSLTVIAEQIWLSPIGPILFFYKFNVSIVLVSSIKWQISIAPRLPSLLSVRSKKFKSW